MNIGQAEGQSSTVALLPPPPALGGERREDSLIIDLSFPLCMVWFWTEQRLTKQQYLEQIGITDLAAQKSLMAEIDRKYEEVSGRDRAGWKVDPPDVLVTGSGWLLREAGVREGQAEGYTLPDAPGVGQAARQVGAVPQRDEDRDPHEGG